MPTPFNDNIQVNAPKPIDNKSGLFKAGAWRPYNDLAEFQATQPIGAQYENQLFWVRSTTDVNKADLYSLRKDKTPYKVVVDVDLSNYYTKEEIDAKLYFEKINFTASNGLQLIDFTLNQRGIKFTNFAIKVFNVAGNIETEVKGFSNTVTKASGLVTSVSLDGIFGNGYILITN